MFCNYSSNYTDYSTNLKFNFTNKVNYGLTVLQKNVRAHFSTACFFSDCKTQTAHSLKV